MKRSKKSILLVVAIALFTGAIDAPAQSKVQEATTPTNIPNPLSTVTIVDVDCSDPKAKIRTIADGLSQVPTSGPSVVRVTGTCNENVEIVGYQNLTLRGNPTATINGGTDPNFAAIAVGGSTVSIRNFIINGGGEGIGCDGPTTTCDIRNVTMQGAIFSQGVSQGSGATVTNRSFANFVNCIIQDNPGLGVKMGLGNFVKIAGSTIRRNGSAATNGAGIAGGSGSIVQVSGSTISDNFGPGIVMGMNGTLTLGSPSSSPITISGNGHDGIALEGGSTAVIQSSTITGNVRFGVEIGDLSFAKFESSNNITGNNAGGVPSPFDIFCGPVYSTTRNIGSAILGGSSTNCPAEQ
jgi:hypothetical protein